MGVAISSAEWQVMRVLWAKPGATSQEVIQALQEGFSWQDTTIKTLLGRLRKKGCLSMEKRGTKYHYYSLIDEEEQLAAEIQNLLSTVCSKKHVRLVDCLLVDGAFSKEHLERLKTKIEEMQDYAPYEVLCNCLKGQCTCQKY